MTSHVLMERGAIPLTFKGAKVMPFLIIEVSRDPH